MYCTVEHIQEEFRDLKFDGTTSITDRQVTRFIQEASVYIDSIIFEKYSLPINEESSPISFTLLRNICIEIVAERVDDIANIRFKDTKLNLQKKEKRPNYQIKLDDILSKKIKLIDAAEKVERRLYVEERESEFDKIRW
ncbi:MAG: DUF1320 family protein [Oligoflexia bacterium]|nr:DUF1320 family protein [Oligoflexia bacterium]